MKFFLFIASCLFFFLAWGELAKELTGFIGWFLIGMGALSLIGALSLSLGSNIGVNGTDGGDSGWGDSGGDCGGD
ncbi:hypothetical protein [Motilimonas pumila]|uniref:Uncharacterized protein n=1 Tax=Motilimonas pumila TaxID=2303987 RepID=A0A418YGI2_9GAMM|nr:hypothetical protein [Motilimonas pumila]RJG48962.1 hypothetical protein D1Z90_07100 [Motilimonas pumila]